MSGTVVPRATALRPRDASERLLSTSLGATLMATDACTIWWRAGRLAHRSPSR